MFYKMSAALMNAQPGATINGTHLGLLTREPPAEAGPKRRRTTESKDLTDNAGSRMLRLGPALTPYCLCPEGSEDENAAISVVQHIWGLAEAIAPPLRWPAARVGVPMFCGCHARVCT